MRRYVVGVEGIEAHTVARMAEDMVDDMVVTRMDPLKNEDLRRGMASGSGTNPPGQSEQPSGGEASGGDALDEAMRYFNSHNLALRDAPPPASPAWQTGGQGGQGGDEVPDTYQDPVPQDAGTAEALVNLIELTQQAIQLGGEDVFDVWALAYAGFADKSKPQQKKKDGGS